MSAEKIFAKVNDEIQKLRIEDENKKKALKENILGILPKKFALNRISDNPEPWIRISDAYNEDDYVIKLLKKEGFKVRHDILWANSIEIRDPEIPYKCIIL